MSALDLRVVNLALAALQKAPADSLDNPTNACERWAVALLPEAKQSALVSWWFPEVRARAVIEASTAAGDALQFGEGKRYRLPLDCLKVHRVGNLKAGGWTREGGFVIAEADTAIWVQYYRQIEIEEAGPLLRRLIAAQLAVDIARAVSDSSAARDRADAFHKDAYARAAGSAGEEAGFANARDVGSSEMAWAGVGHGRLDPVERSRG
jgi:hypothetical protein